MRRPASKRPPLAYPIYLSDYCSWIGVRPQRELGDKLAVDLQKIVAFSVDLFKSAETPVSADILTRSLRRSVYFDISAIIRYASKESSVFLYDNFHGLTSPDAMKPYLAGTYLLDRVYTACRTNVTGLKRLTDLTPDIYFESEYYASVNLHPACQKRQAPSPKKSFTS